MESGNLMVYGPLNLNAMSQKYTGECMNNAYLGGVAAGIIVTASLYLFQRKARPVAGR